MGSVQLTCGVLIYDAKASGATPSVVIRPCGAPANRTIVIGHDTLFAACSRHDRRLDRAGVRAADTRGRE